MALLPLQAAPERRDSRPLRHHLPQPPLLSETLETSRFLVMAEVESEMQQCCPKQLRMQTQVSWEERIVSTRAVHKLPALLADMGSHRA